MFLTADDLVTLTGYRKPAMQIKYLQRNGIPHTVNAFGRPVVAVATVERLHGMKQSGGLIKWDKVA